TRLVVMCEGELDFTNRGHSADALERGWSVAEPDGTWNDGTNAVISCRSVSPPKTFSRVEINGRAFAPSGRRQRLKFSVNGHSRPELTWDSGQQQSFFLALPGSSSGRWEFRFEFPDAISPKELDMSRDARRLAFKIRSLRFE